MLVQLLHLLPERFRTVSQHALEWIFGVWVRWRKHYVVLLAAIKIVLLVSVSNIKEDQSAVVLVVHYQDRNEINHNRKENRDWHSRKFLSNLFFYPYPSLIQESEINSSTSQTLLCKKDDLSSWPLAREEFKRIHRINIQVLPLSRRHYDKRKTCPDLLNN